MSFLGPQLKVIWGPKSIKAYPPPPEPLGELVMAGQEAEVLPINEVTPVSSAAESCPTLRPHGLQHARPPHPSPTPGACSDSCPLSHWCRPAVSSSVIPFSCLHSFPASGSFPWVSSSHDSSPRSHHSRKFSVLSGEANSLWDLQWLEPQASLFCLFFISGWGHKTEAVVLVCENFFPFYFLVKGRGSILFITFCVCGSPPLLSSTFHFPFFPTHRTFWKLIGCKYLSSIEMIVHMINNESDKGEKN